MSGLGDRFRRRDPAAAPAAEPAPAAPLSTWARLEAEGIVASGRGSYGMEDIGIHEFRGPDGAWLGTKLRIGRYCSLAPFELFLGGDHRAGWVTTFPFRTIHGLPGAESDQLSRGDVVIGNDVWIGRDAVVMSGVTIGDGAVIGAKAVVAKDVRPYAVVVGNPGREVKRRFDDETVDALLRLRWWDWPEERILASLPLLTSAPEALLAEGGEPS